jgi:hypothetical protein
VTIAPHGEWGATRCRGSTGGATPRTIGLWVDGGAEDVRTCEQGMGDEKLVEALERVLRSIGTPR